MGCCATCHLDNGICCLDVDMHHIQTVLLVTHQVLIKHACQNCLYYNNDSFIFNLTPWFLCCIKDPVVCFYVIAFSNQTKRLQPLNKKEKKSFYSRGNKPSPLFLMNIWSQFEKGYGGQRDPTTKRPNFTTNPDSATVTSWLEVEWAEHVEKKTLALNPACSIWVMELTDSGMWMCVCWQTPLHPEWGLWLHLIMRVASLLSLSLPRLCPSLPQPPPPLPLTTVPLGQSCGHTTWLLAAQECSWQKQPEARHVEKIQSAHNIPPPPTPPHFLALTNRGTRVFPSAHLWRKMASHSSCLSGWGCVTAFATVRGICFKQPCTSMYGGGGGGVPFTRCLPQSGRCRQLLFVSWVALLVSCNIKLAVSESFLLSVSLVVLACQAAHLCLLDKTCSTLPWENILSPLPFLFLHLPPMLSLSLLFLSFSIIPFVCHAPSPRFSVTFLSFIFFKSAPFPPQLFSLLSCTVYFPGFLPCFSFSIIPFLPLSLPFSCPFLFCIILGPLCQPFGS